MNKNFNKGLHANIEHNNKVKANTDFLNNSSFAHQIR